MVRETWKDSLFSREVDGHNGYGHLDFRSIFEIGINSNFRDLFRFSRRFYIIIGFGFIFFYGILYKIAEHFGGEIIIGYRPGNGIRISLIGSIGTVIGLGIGFGGIISSFYVFGVIRRFIVEKREREIEVEADGWHRTFNTDFPGSVLKSLLLSAPTSQLTPVQCCVSCGPIVATDCNVDLPDIRAVAQSCQLCVLLRTLLRHSSDEKPNIQIVNEQSALEIGSQGPRILRLCSESEYSPDPGDNIQIGFPILPEAENLGRFALLRAWLRRCDESHHCNKRNTGFNAALPTRLLYVGDPDPDVLRLYLSKDSDRVKYVALSHCWGLNPGDKPDFCTTEENVKQRLKKFSSSILPKTFQDAIRVARKLGIQYLWIDSLCIIQWNKKDWEHEAKRMESVFALAYCTIAATSAINSETGFLERNVSSERYVYVQDALGRRFSVCTTVDNFENDVEKARLNTRAWVMQERILSRRTVHFSTNQTYFECGEGVYCENLTRLESPFRNQFFMLDPNFPDRLLASGDQRTMKFIHFLSKNYSNRGLTEKTDRCVAISGLEARITHARRCQSRYGIFQPYIHRNLLWQRSDGETTERIGYETQTVPSWSWMAYSGGIQFMDIPFGDVEWNHKLRFNKERKHLFFNNSKVEGRHALVTDIGVFQKCRLGQSNISYAVLDSGSETETGRIWYDIEAYRDLDTERCVVVGRSSRKNEHGLRDKKYYILVVRPTVVDGEYTRVGVGWIENDYVARQRLNVLVV